ncbi:hypothetical protein P280DRAFT_115520 [Massarina eburnea CBS 473.64]|uniref:Uncharacterized protein n=1 Tax=Massarina eburnea CBS 473.64 TaxID=1395130 RepID=A0A6A6SFR0_9PLEO|nr:hypothetical protein P280DRAFT_115520 [Massarina eburnea CBS 473.64]
MFAKRITSQAGSIARPARLPISRTLNPRTRIQSPRFQSTSSSSSSGSGSGSSAAIGALTGTLATVTIGYVWYRQSGARELLSVSKTTTDYYNSTSKKLKEATPEPNEALNWLRSTATSYAAFIPGARGYVDAAFDDIDAVRAKHGKEVDDIVREAYSELQGIVSKGDLSLTTAEKAWSSLVKQLGRIADLAGDASQQILDNHPQLKEKVGGNFAALKDMGENYGPEAKKEVDRTWKQISDIVKTGVSAQNVEKVQKVVQEKVDKLRKVGDEAWKKGMEQAKPYLDKNPQVKKLVEENADLLKQGNVQDLYQKVRKAVESGDLGDLKSYVEAAVKKGKDSGSGSGSGFPFSDFLDKIPGGDQILPKLGQLQDVAQKHGDEAKRILEDAVKEIEEVLRKRGGEAEDLAKKAKGEGKK